MNRSCARLTLGLALALSLSTLCAGAQSVDEDVRYVPVAGWDGGAAAVANPYGGAYVYSADQPSQARVPQRFVLNRGARDDYTLFSAEEEQALWGLRAQIQLEREQLAEASQPKPVARSHARRRVAIVWPRVVVLDDKTCVPRLEFSESTDWREHLVCWLSGEKRVE